MVDLSLYIFPKATKCVEWSCCTYNPIVGITSATSSSLDGLTLVLALLPFVLTCAPIVVCLPQLGWVQWSPLWKLNFYGLFQLLFHFLKASFVFFFNLIPHFFLKVPDNLIPPLFLKASNYLNQLLLTDGCGGVVGATWCPSIVLNNGHTRPRCTNTTPMVQLPNGSVQYVVTTMGNKATLCSLLF